MADSTITLDTNFRIGEIDRRIFGGFLEHLGRAVYEGVYDPGSPLADARGFRTDVIAALKRLAMPVMRYPGGNFVSAYNWTDGIGPRKSRPRRPEFAWSSIESNQFGTDEFMQWCKQLGTAPMMAVNLGTAGPNEAMQLVEYCNLPTGTYWSDRRQANGHAEPYGVKLWCLGNEMDGIWQAGHVPADVYAQRALAASIMMKGLDRSIETIACGSSGRGISTYLKWDRTVLEHCWEKIDYISAHGYSGNWDHDSAGYLAEGIEIDRVIDDYAGLIAYVRGRKRSSKHVYVSFDEWNVWYRHRSENGGWREAPHLLEEEYNFEDALVCAQYLGSFLRHADVVKIACLAQIVNVIAPIMTRKDGLLFQTIFHPIELFARAARGVSLRASTVCPLYAAGKRGEVPTLDVSATFNPLDESAAVFVINRDSSQDVQIRLDDRTIVSIVGVDLMGGAALTAQNTWENPTAVHPFPGGARIVNPQELLVRVPGPGMAVVRLATKVR